MVHPPTVHRLLAIALATTGALLAGCNKAADVPAAAAENSSPAAAPAPAPAPAPPPVAAAPVAAPAAPSYTPPTADKLYQLVAPIALYPDKLVAQVLAGSTYPTQVTDADQWLRQNANLKAGPLADAADRQPWDPSIKSLTAFRSVLDQMANNLPWTTALGEAYYNDPSDVMNAIQVMRQRASRAGQLKSTPQLKVASGTPQIDYTPNPNAPAVYGGQAVVEPPPQHITIAPAQPDVVYVPAYDPQRIYGEPVRMYPGYTYAPPQPVYSEPRYSNAQIATAGAVTFGLGVVVGAALERHDWGWHSWGVNWGDRGGDRRGDVPRDARDGRAYQQPAVVYNRSTYVSRSETVVNNNVRNVYNNGPAMREVQAQQAQLEHQAQQVQMQRDQVQREQLQTQQSQMQMRMAQLRQQQEQQEQARQQQARDQQMHAQQQRTDQARQQQEQQRQQQMQQQAQQQDQARRQQEQSRRQQEQVQQQQRDQQAQAQQQRVDQARQQQEQQRQQQQQAQQQHQQQVQQQAQQQARVQQEQQRQQQEQARQQQEQQRQQQEQARHQQEQQRQQAEQQGRQQQQQQRQQAEQRQQHEQQAQQHRPQAQPQRAAERGGDRRQGEEQRP